LYRGIQPSNLPLNYSPGGRPLGMGDPGNGGQVQVQVPTSTASDLPYMGGGFNSYLSTAA